jgi:hypothetical protein
MLGHTPWIQEPARTNDERRSTLARDSGRLVLDFFPERMNMHHISPPDFFREQFVQFGTPAQRPTSTLAKSDPHPAFAEVFFNGIALGRSWRRNYRYLDPQPGQSAR